MDPREHPSVAARGEHVDNHTAQESSVRYLFWDGDRLLPCSPMALERIHAEPTEAQEG